MSARWKDAAAHRRGRELRAALVSGPRCEVCRRPLSCGQERVHLSCRTGRPS